MAAHVEWDDTVLPAEQERIRIKSKGSTIAVSSLLVLSSGFASRLDSLAQIPDRRRVIIFVFVLVHSLFAFALGTGRCDGIALVGGQNLETRRSHEAVDEIPKRFADAPIVSDIAELFSDS